MARRLVKICNIQNDSEMSNDIRKRNIPSMSLQPQFGLRPVSTKYAHFPIIDTQISNEIPIYKKPYNVGLIFNSGLKKSTSCLLKKSKIRIKKRVNRIIG